MSKHSSFADEMPDLYPADAGTKRDDQIDSVQSLVDKLLKDNPGLTQAQRRDLFKNNGLRASLHGEKVTIEILSPIAPELDCWFDVLPDPPPRDLDSPWRA